MHAFMCFWILIVNFSFFLCAVVKAFHFSASLHALKTNSVIQASVVPKVAAFTSYGIYRAGFFHKVFTRNSHSFSQIFLLFFYSVYMRERISPPKVMNTEMTEELLSNTLGRQ